MRQSRLSGTVQGSQATAMVSTIYEAGISRGAKARER